MATANKGDSRRERERQRLLALKHRQPGSDSKNGPGVLLSDVIRQYVEWFDLIRPFDERNLKPANYKLSVGDQYAINGQIKELKDESGKNELSIPPFAVAIIQTRETISMPRFLIGRWNIQVRRAYEGLVWVGGPQVDAGYVGYLFCPIYNLSDKPVILRWGEAIAVIDFVKTSEFHEGKSKSYDELPEKVLFEDYNPQQLISGLVTHAESQIKTFREEIANVSKSMTTTQSRIDSFVLLTFGAVSVLFAALTIFVSRPSGTGVPWNLSVFLISGLAIFLSLSAYLQSGAIDQTRRRILEMIFVTLLVLAVAFLIDRVHVQQVEINDLRSRIQPRTAPQPQASPSAPPATPQTPPQTVPPLGAPRPAPSQTR